jgi:hypothetical protein
MRDSIERYVMDEPSFLRLGMQYFGGKRRSIPDGLKAASSAALLLGRLGLRKVWG